MGAENLGEWLEERHLAGEGCGRAGGVGWGSVCFACGPGSPWGSDVSAGVQEYLLADERLSAAVSAVWDALDESGGAPILGRVFEEDIRWIIEKGLKEMLTDE